MTDNSKIRALELMTLAHEQLLEMVLGTIFAEVGKEKSEAIKLALSKNAERYVRDYEGPPTDAKELQVWGEILQSEIDRVVNRAEFIERSIRQPKN